MLQAMPPNPPKRQDYLGKTLANINGLKWDNFAYGKPLRSLVSFRIVFFLRNCTGGKWHKIIF